MDTRPFFVRISERKFLVYFAAQVAALLAIFWPQYASEIEAVCVRVAALVMLGLAAFGYARMEASLDAARITPPGAAGADPPPASSDAPAAGGPVGHTDGEPAGPS